MYQIKLLNKISASGLSVLPIDNYNCSEDVENPDGVIVRSASMHEMELPPALQVVARAGAGVNNIPIEKCSQLGIAVFNTPGANANAVKELTIMGLLMSARKIFPAMMWVQDLKGRGEAVPDLVEKGKSEFAGPEIKGKKLGLIGLGKIGGIVANAAWDLGMEVCGYTPFLTVEDALKINPGVHRADTIGEIYSQCDFISLHVPSNKETKEMINASTMASMKKGVRILNFSRGDLVNNADMIAALDKKHVRCYLTDFPDDGLLGHPGVIALPHLGSSTPESEETCAVMAAASVKDYLETGNVRNSINLPEIRVPRSGRPRIAVIHKNVPKMITQITGLGQVNINNLSTDSKGAIGYLIMDLDAPATEEQLQKIRALDGVFRVRYFK